MNQKKITYVIHYHNDRAALVKTLESITKQEVHHVHYDVLIFDDAAPDHGAKAIRSYIQEKQLLNVNLVAFANPLGFAGIYHFMMNNDLLKSEYVSFLKPGDLVNQGWINHFCTHLYPLKQDLYWNSVEAEVVTAYLKETKRQQPTLEIQTKQFLINPNRLRGSLTSDQMVASWHIFIGKIYRLETIKNMPVAANKILYQEFAIYQKLISKCQSAYADNFVAGFTVFKPLPTEILTKEHVKLLNKTLNPLINKADPVLNGVILKLIALAMQQTQKESLHYYRLHKFADLKKNFKLKKIKGLNVNHFMIKRKTKLLATTGKNRPKKKQPAAAKA